VNLAVGGDEKMRVAEVMLIYDIEEIIRIDDKI
jgi:hypothetical protein